MDILVLDSVVFKDAIENYNPKIKDFFNAELPSFSNYREISQGEIGDCWFLSALAALSKSSTLREILRRNFAINPDTKQFIIKLYAEEERTVVIDGRLIYIPKIQGYKSDLLFAGQQHFLPEKRKIPLELTWYAFFEKAMATLYGGYQFLDGGDPESSETKEASEGFLRLTGMKAFTLSIDESIPISEVKKYLDAGSAMVYSTKTNKEVNLEKKMKETPDGLDMSEYNLLEDHAYVIDSISDTGDVQLYNPHGEFGTLKVQNTAKLLPLAAFIYFGKRIDAVIVHPKGGARTRRRRRRIVSRRRHR
jgi:hypothetical protein